MMIREITVKSYEDGKLTVEGFEGEEFEDVEWRKQAGLTGEPKIGSKGLALMLGSAERMSVVSIDEHAPDGPIGLTDSRGQKVELNNEGALIEAKGQKVTMVAAGVTIESSARIDLKAPEVYINDVLQSGS